METGSKWDGLGIIQSAEQECPGVWLISAAPEDSVGFCVEYYVVWETTPTISKKASCIPIFEMLPLHPEWVTDTIIDKTALMNAVCGHYPQYAISYNLREQAGKNDMLGKAAQHICPEYELHSDLENMVAFSGGTNTEFWSFLQ